MASRVQKIKLWDTFKNAKSVILHFFPVAEIGRNIHLLYFSYPQQIYSQFVEWGKKVLSPYSPQLSVYYSVSLMQIARKHPVVSTHQAPVTLSWSVGEAGKKNTASHCGLQQLYLARSFSAQCWGLV